MSSNTYSTAGILTSDPVLLGSADAPASGGRTLTVGAGGQYASLAAAIAAANNGDVIAIRGGTTLTNDFSYVTKNITIEGVGGMVNMVATQPPPNQKGILVTEGNVTVKNISFSGVAVSDASGGNGAGIRYDFGNLNVVNCDFHNNQDGILANPDPTGSVTIDHSTFANNGSGSGYTHDIYIGEVTKFTLTNSVVASANVGHEVKSRADVTDIENNIIQDGPTGTGSYDIDIPNGGAATVKGNYIEKGPDAQNLNMVHFGGEGIPYANSSLDIENNSFVNDRGSSTVALLNQTLAIATVAGNSFVNVSFSNLVNGGANLTGNVDGNGTPIASVSQGALAPGPGVWIFTDGLDHSLTFTGYGMSAQGGSGHLSITSDWGHETVIGGSGGLTYSDTGPDSQEWADVITTAAGSTNVIQVVGGDTINSNGIDTITLGSGNCTIGIRGSARISGGTGSNSFQDQGSLVLAVAGTSSNTVTVAAGAAATVTGTAAYLQGDWSGGNFAFAITQGGTALAESFIGGGGEVKVYNGAANVTLAGGTVPVTVSLTSGDTVLRSLGADVIHVGSGNDTIIVSGNAQIYAGSGTLGVYGRGETGTATVFGNGGSILIDGDGGGIRYVGNGSAAVVTDNLSHTEIDGGSGHISILGGGFIRTIIGGSGGIDVTAPAGGDVITTAAGSLNTITRLTNSTVYSNGTDSISGVSGTNTVVFSGPRASYSAFQSGSTVVVSGSGVNDTLTSIGQLKFADVSLSTSSLPFASSVSQLLAGSGAMPAAVIDEAANVQSNLTSLESLAEAGKIASLFLSDPGGPVLTLSSSQLTQDATILKTIVGSVLLQTPNAAATVAHFGSGQTVLQAPSTAGAVIGGGNDILSDPAVAAADSGLRANGDGSLTVTTAGGSQHVSGISQIQFADRTITVATADEANVARLYQAAFGRPPDASGLAAWENIYASVSASLKASSPVAALAMTPLAGLPSIASGFTNSTEFKSTYGSLSNADYLTRIYTNVLGRVADQAGYTAWLGAMNSGAYTKEMVLVGFAESSESVALTGFSPNHPNGWLFSL